MALSCYLFWWVGACCNHNAADLEGNPWAAAKVRESAMICTCCSDSAPTSHLLQGVPRSSGMCFALEFFFDSLSCSSTAAAATPRYATRQLVTSTCGCSRLVSHICAGAVTAAISPMILVPIPRCYRMDILRHPGITYCEYVLHMILYFVWQQLLWRNESTVLLVKQSMIVLANIARPCLTLAM